MIRNIIIAAAALAASSAAQAQEVEWPGGKKAAIALTYDDSLDSHLDIVLPQLDARGMKGSFYLIAHRDPFTKRFTEWADAAARGHELANHTLAHPCSSSLPGREWVTSLDDLDSYTIERVASEVAMTNDVLAMVDGKTTRTFGLPCGDTEAGDGNFVSAIQPMFLAMRDRPGDAMPGVPVAYAGPVGSTGVQLIADAERMIATGGVGIYIFHGVGGDHLVVPADSHEQLLDWLAEHEADVWIAPYRDIVEYVQAQQAE